MVFLPDCSWKDIVNKANAQGDEKPARGYPRSLRLDAKPGQEMQRGSSRPPSEKRGEEHRTADQEGERGRTDDEELEMGMVSLILCCTLLIYC